MTMMFKSVLSLAIATGCLMATPARADSAQVIVETMNLDEQFMKGIRPILPMMTDQMVAQMKAGGLSLVSRIENEGKGGLPRFKQIIKEEFLSAIEEKMPAFNSEIEAILRANLSDAQLRDVEQFIQTEAGKQFFAVVYGGMQEQTQRFGERIGAEAGSIAVSRAMARSEAEQF